jgi:beta-galactosidase
MYKNDNFIKEYTHGNKDFPNLLNAPIKIDDYIGDALENEKDLNPKQIKDIKDILNEVAKFGLYRMTPSAKLKAAKLMLFHHMKMDDAVKLYNKYVGDWGGSATEYRFEAIKDGKVVKELKKTPMTKVCITAEADHTSLKEDHTYDVSCVRIKAVDENGNLLNYYNDPLILEIEGEAELIGPKLIALSGGMGGTFVRSTGRCVSAKLVIKDAYDTQLSYIDFDIAVD